jgi:hypothetical protein
MTYSLNQMLSSWGGYPSDKPKIFRTNYDGNAQAIWYWTESTEDGREVLAVATIVTFKDDEGTIVWTFVEDALSRYADDPLTNDDGEPYYEDYGEGYNEESIEFDRDEILKFLRDFLSGRLELSERTGGWFSQHWIDKAGTPAGRTRLPRSKEQIARWIESMGESAVQWHSGGDWQDGSIEEDFEISVES